MIELKQLNAKSVRFCIGKKEEAKKIFFKISWENKRARDFYIHVCYFKNSVCRVARLELEEGCNIKDIDLTNTKSVFVNSMSPKWSFHESGEIHLKNYDMKKDILSIKTKPMVLWKNNHVFSGIFYGLENFKEYYISDDKNCRDWHLTISKNKPVKFVIHVFNKPGLEKEIGKNIADSSEVLSACYYDTLNAEIRNVIPYPTFIFQVNRDNYSSLLFRIQCIPDPPDFFYTKSAGFIAYGGHELKDGKIEALLVESNVKI